MAIFYLKDDSQFSLSNLGDLTFNWIFKCVLNNLFDFVSEKCVFFEDSRIPQNSYKNKLKLSPTFTTYSKNKNKKIMYCF